MEHTERFKQKQLIQQGYVWRKQNVGKEKLVHFSYKIWEPRRENINFLFIHAFYTEENHPML